MVRWKTLSSRKGFVWDTTSRANPGNVSPEDSEYINIVDEGSLENGTFEVNAENLDDNTIYYYRAFGYDGETYIYGDEQSFTTLEYVLPTIEDFAIVEIKPTEVDLTANITDQGSHAVTERGFVLSTTSNPTTDDTKLVVGDGTGIFADTITELDFFTEYYIRAYAVSEGGTQYSNELNFTTLKDPNRIELTPTRTTNQRRDQPAIRVRLN